MPQQKALSTHSRNTQTVTVTKQEYDRLQQLASRFEIMRNFFELDFFMPPSTQNSGTILRELKKTGKYNVAFLKSLKRGLKDSSYFQNRSSR